MKLITKEFVRTIVGADPSRNDLVEVVEIHLRYGGTVRIQDVATVKGGLECADADDRHILHLIDEENIAGVTVKMHPSKAITADIHCLPALLTHAEKRKA